MTKKLAAILALSAAGLLAGGTFAAYVVTDNANPFGIQIAPQTISAENVQNISLSYGESGTLYPGSTRVNAGITSLSVNTRLLIGSIALKAEKTAGEGDFTSYEGLLDMSLTDITVYGDETPTDYLYKYLHVEVFDDASVEEVNDVTTPKVNATAKAEIPPSTAKYSTSVTATGTPAGKLYYVYVTLDSTATPYLNEFADQKVYLQFNWNKAENATKKTIYISSPDAWSADSLNVYAYSASETTKAWPGEAATKISDHYFSYELSTGFTTIIFNDGNGKQTVDFTLDYTKPYFTVGTETEGDKYKIASNTAESSTITLNEGYYVTGKIGGVEKWVNVVGTDQCVAMDLGVAPSTDVAVKSGLVLAAGDEIKVVHVDDKKAITWYGPNGSEDGSNWSIVAAGTYTVYLNASYNMWVEKTA